MFTYLEAAGMAMNPLSAGVIKSVATQNELMGRLSFMEVQGDSHLFSREGALPGAEFVDLTNPTTTESSSTAEQMPVPLRLISTDFDLSNASSNYTTPNGDPFAFQLSQKLRAAGSKIQSKAITGGYVTGFTKSNPSASPAAAVTACVPSAGIDTKLQGPITLKYTHSGTKWALRAPGDLSFGPDVVISANGSASLYSYGGQKSVYITVTVASATADGEVNIYTTSSTQEPDGMLKLCPDSQLIQATATDGDALSLDKLDRLLVEKVVVGKENRVFLMNAKLKIKYLALARAASLSERMAIEVMGPNGKIGMQDVPSYGGVPILQVDDIPNTEAKGSGTTLSSVLCVSLSPIVGFHGVVQSQGEFANVNLDPYAARIGGFKLYDVGQRESVAASRHRVEWYGAFGLGSPLAIGRASQLITA